MIHIEGRNLHIRRKGWFNQADIGDSHQLSAEASLIPPRSGYATPVCANYSTLLIKGYDENSPVV